MPADRVAAFARQRAAVLDYCAGLSDAEWYTASAAAGWRAHDVIAHLAAGWWRGSAAWWPAPRCARCPPGSANSAPSRWAWRCPARWCSTTTPISTTTAPVLGKPAPATDPADMAVVVDWMLAVWANQLRAAPPR